MVQLWAQRALLSKELKMITTQMILMIPKYLKLFKVGMKELAIKNDLASIEPRKINHNQENKTN